MQLSFPHGYRTIIGQSGFMSEMVLEKAYLTKKHSYLGVTIYTTDRYVDGKYPNSNAESAITLFIR